MDKITIIILVLTGIGLVGTTWTLVAHTYQQKLNDSYREQLKLYDEVTELRGARIEKLEYWIAELKKEGILASDPREQYKLDTTDTDGPHYWEAEQEMQETDKRITGTGC